MENGIVSNRYLEKLAEQSRAPQVGFAVGTGAGVGVGIAAKNFARKEVDIAHKSFQANLKAKVGAKNNKARRGAEIGMKYAKNALTNSVQAARAFRAAPVVGGVLGGAIGYGLGKKIKD